MNKKILGLNPLFCGMNNEQTEKALSAFLAFKQDYQKNSTIVSVGKKMLRFGLVLSGTVQVSFTDIDGNEVLMASVVSGETFGESLCLLKTEEIPVNVTAFTDVSVLWLSPDILRGNDSSAIACELRNRFFSMLARKTLMMNDRIQILSKPTVRQKIITFLSQYSNNFGTKTFSVPFDRETLALYLGVNRSALSRELSLMQKDGIIEFYKNTFKILK